MLTVYTASTVNSVCIYMQVGEICNPIYRLGKAECKLLFSYADVGMYHKNYIHLKQSYGVLPSFLDCVENDARKSEEWSLALTTAKICQSVLVDQNLAESGNLAM